MANDSTPDALTPALPPEPHDATGEREATARMLRQRARALLSLAILLLPAFALGHAWLLPTAKLALAATHAVLLLACALAREAASRAHRMGALRSLMCRAYTLLFAGAAVVCLQLAAFGAQAPLASHVLALGFFLLIALSIPAGRIPSRDLGAIALGASPSLAVAICWAPSAVLPVYLIGFGVAAAVVWRLVSLSVARRAEALVSR